jgi:transcription elongation factor SPT6
LLEENTGTRISRKNKLTRLRRGRESESPVESKTKPFKSLLDDQFSEDEDDLGVEPPAADDVRGIWDDERGAGRDLDDEVDMDDDFIDDDLEEDGMGDLGEEEREERRKERLRVERERRKALGRPNMVGIDARCVVLIYKRIYLTPTVYQVPGMKFLKSLEMAQTMIGRSKRTMLLQ